VHILWLKTELLHPVDKGGRIRTYNMLRELKREHRVTYLTLDDGTAAPDARERAMEYCDELVTVPFSTAPKRSPRFFAELAANLLSPLPYAVAKYRSPAMERRVSELAGRGGVDVVVCDFLFPSLNVPSGLSAPTVLFQHNVEAVIWERHAQVAGNPVARAYMRAQWRRMARHEGRECRRFDHVVAVSPQDAEAFREQYGVASVSDVATGVDTEYFRPTGREERRPHELVFTGSMDWMPNEDAILYFADEILPRVRARVPDVALTVVGRNPPPRVRALGDADPAIRVTGSVPDVRPYIERAAFFVIPLRVGGGTRLKVFEAMAMEKAVVSTSVGTEGLPVRDGVDAVLRDTPEGFADAVVDLLAHPERAAAIGREAARVVRARYGWEGVAAQFADACAAAGARRRPGAAPASDGAAGAAALAGSAGPSGRGVLETHSTHPEEQVKSR
jgi:sugar transferase (PEP-CTERM/EpsH1 system associated)